MSDDVSSVEDVPSVDELISATPEISLDGDQLGLLSQDPGGTVQTFPWPVCITYAGRPWWSGMLLAPSADGALVTARGFAAKFNAVAPSLGYPGLFAAQGGLCPPS